MNLDTINGVEIIEFLNDLISNNNELCHISLCGSLILEYQIVENDTYKLFFTGYFNNWGRSEPTDNQLSISKDGSILFLLDEPHEGDGTDSVLGEILSVWLKNHIFADVMDVEQKINFLYDDAYSKLLDYTNRNVNGISEIIKILTEAKSLMK